MSACPFCGRPPRTGHLYEICVLDGREERDSDTRRMAETPKSGSVRSTGSAGLKGIAQ